MRFRIRQSGLSVFSVVLVLLAALPIAKQLYGFGDLTTNELIWLCVGLLVLGIPAAVMAIQDALALSRAHR